MKLLIAGSRSIKVFDLAPYISEAVDTIISGGASGIDALAEKYADRHKISKYILRPHYERFGRAAPLRRNEEMVDLADAVLVVWDGKSRGAKHTVSYAKKMKKPVTLVTV